MVKTVFDGSSYFEENKPRILVRNDVHHGRMYAHEHTFFEIVYVENGFSLHSFNGKTAILTAGDMFAVSPGNTHAYFSAHHASIYNLLFDRDELAGFEDRVSRLPGFSRAEGCAIANVPLGDRQELKTIFEKIMAERCDMRAGWETALTGCLLQAIVIFSRLASESGAPGNGKVSQDAYFKYILKALEYIEENYKKKLTADDIAAYAGLSKGYFNKQFKAKMDMTPTEYVRVFRIAKSMELLKTTAKSVSEAAAESGFSDITMFSRVFKQVTGKSPVSYKKSFL